MKFVERNKIVNGIVPVSANGGKTGDYVSLKNYNHCTAIVTVGAVAATCHIHTNRATDVSATGATSVSLTYYTNANINAWNAEDGTSTDTLTAVTTAANPVTIAVANSQFIWDFDAIELGDYDCFSVAVSDPSGATLVGLTYILSEPRFSQATPPTGIVD